MNDFSEIASQRLSGGRTGINQASCFSYQHYSGALRSLKATALCWLVQFAIRAELHKACETDWEIDENQYRSRPYLKLRANAGKLRELIRRKHILDEPALSGIGMTLYDFPILFTFFGGGDFRNYVREPTVNEIMVYLSEMVLMGGDPSSASGSVVPRMSVDEIGTRIKHMTRTQLENQVLQNADESSSTRRLISVNMAAPVSVLKAQFLDILERSAKQKNEITVMIETWLRYGVLPFIDLRESVTRDGMKRVSVNNQIRLLYDPDLARYNKEGEELERGPKTLNETTKPHALKMLDTQSQPFCALAAAATREFNDAIAFARDSNNCDDPEAARETFRRWIPRTYPHNLSAIELAMEILPERAPTCQAFLEHLDRGGELTWSIEERIRNRASHPGELRMLPVELFQDDAIDVPDGTAQDDDDFEIEPDDGDGGAGEWWQSLFREEWVTESEKD